MRTFLKESFVPVLILLAVISSALVILKHLAVESSRQPQVIEISLRDVITSAAPRPRSRSLDLPVSSAVADTLDAAALDSLGSGAKSAEAGWVGRAMAMAARDSVDQALNLLSSLLARNPHHGSAWFATGVILSRRGDRPAAIDAYQKAASYTGGRAKAVPLYNLACLYRDAGRKSEAIVTYRRAIDQRPDYPEARLNLAVLLGEEQETREEAYRLYEQTIRLDPNYAQAHFNRGVLRINDGKPAEAAQDFERTVAIDPKHTKAWFNLGLLASRRDDTEKAANAYGHAVEVDPMNTKARLNLATALSDLKRYDDAILVGRETVRRIPNLAAAWYNLAIAFSEAGRSGEAKKAYEKVLKLEPKHARAWQNLGVLYAREKNSKRAMECYREALALDPANVAARYNLALELRRSGDLKGAIEEATRLYRMDPDHDKAKVFLQTTAARLLQEDPKNLEAQGILEQIRKDGGVHAP